MMTMENGPEKLLITLDPSEHPEELLALAEREGLPADLSIPSVRDRVWELWLAQKHSEIEEYRKTLPPGTELVVLAAEVHGEDEWGMKEGVHDPVIEARNASYADAIVRLPRSPRYSGYRLVLVERNMLNWPPAVQRMQAAIAAWKRTDPNARVLVVELPEPPIMELLDKRRNELLDYTTGDESLTEKGRAARSQLATLSKRLDALETLQSSISPQERRRLQQDILGELARIRRDDGSEIVHNEPKKWIRTAANDSDMLLQYMINKDFVKYFGILIYTDLDKSTVEYIRSNWDAIDQVTGPALMMFAFENIDRLMSRNRILAHNAVLAERQKRVSVNEGVEIVSELPAVHQFEQSILNHMFTRNDSVQVARRLGIQQGQIPCMLIFSPLREGDLIVYEFRDKWVETGEFTDHLRRIVDVLEAATSAENGGVTRGIKRRLLYFRTRKWLGRNVSETTVMEAVGLVASATLGG